jgi:hypothetical protein
LPCPSEYLDQIVGDPVAEAWSKVLADHHAGFAPEQVAQD